MANDKKYYVYTHTRVSDGMVFYVGKGHGDRSNLKSGRSKWWRDVHDKHGCSVDIISDRMSEDCAFTLEKITISKYRSLGHPLVNMTDGGEGCSGRRMSQSTLKTINKHRYVKVYCSNGMEFEGVKLAAIWLKGQGFDNASTTMICRVRDKSNATAYGYAWSSLKVPDKPKVTGNKAKSHAAKKSRSVPIFCSNGMDFTSITDAVSWLSSIGKTKSATGNISAAARGRIKSAYGYEWSYIKKPPIKGA